MVMEWVTTGKVGVKGLDLVDKSLLDPEVQSSVHDRRHSLLTWLSDCGQHVVRFDRGSTGRQDLQDTSAAARQAQAVLSAMRSRIPENLFMCAPVHQMRFHSLACAANRTSPSHRNAAATARS